MPKHHTWEEERARRQEHATLGGTPWARRRGHPVLRGRFTRDQRGRVRFITTPPPSDEAKKAL